MGRNIIEEIIDKYNVFILDGGLATEIQDRGMNLNDELWSAKILAENPEIIERVHYEYYKAGADCSISASYQASIDGFFRKGFSEEEAKNLIKKSVELVIKARERYLSESHEENRLYPIVAGSVGPYAAYFADGSESIGYSNVDKEEFIKYHSERIKLLIEAGAEVLAVETIPSLAEAEAILEILKEYPDIYCWISFRGENDEIISDGTLLSECAKQLDKYEQVAAIGVNCTEPRYISGAIKNIKKNTNKPIVIYPNSGEKFDVDTKEWGGKREEFDFGVYSKKWYEEGATVIGGCCRTTPKDIEKIAKWARN